jgi:hypothetical protein
VSEGFSNPIIGGGGALVYPSIHSPNFVNGVSGWSIDKDGNAFFNSVTLPPGAGGATIFVQPVAPVANKVNDLWVNTAAGNQVLTWTGAAWAAQKFGTGAIAAGAITAALIAAGTVVAGIINGTTVTAATINGSVFNGTDFAFLPAGLFFYSGAPAAGNLILTIGTTASGTDAFGNPFQQGNIVVYSGAATYTTLGASSAGNLVLSAGSGGGAGLEFPPQAATPVSVQSILYADTNGNLSFRNGPGGYNGQLVNSKTDIAPRSTLSTAGAPQQISGLLNLPAGDAAAGTIYRITLPGGGSTGTVQGATSVQAALNGTSVANTGWPAATIPVGTGFTWLAVATVIILTTGPAGTALFHVGGWVGLSGRSPAANAQVFGAYSTATVTINTTVANTLSILGQIAGTGCTLTGLASTFERLGP